MPPIISKPTEGGSTKTNTSTFDLKNAHYPHPGTNTTKWKITITTQRDNGGTLKTQTSWNFSAIPSSCSVSGLPADGGTYYCQIVYVKSGSADSWVGTSNKFTSLRS